MKEQRLEASEGGFQRSERHALAYASGGHWRQHRLHAAGHGGECAERCELCGATREDEGHVWECKALRHIHAKHSRVHRCRHVLPEQLRHYGVVPQVRVDPSKSFWGQACPDLHPDDAKWMGCGAGAGLRDGDLPAMLERGLTLHGMMARLTNYEPFPVGWASPVPCDERPPATVTVYADGSVACPGTPWAARGAVGLCWTRQQQRIDGAPWLVYDGYEPEVGAAKQQWPGATVGQCALTIARESSTRVEAQGLLAALCHDGPQHIVCDNATAVVQVEKLQRCVLDGALQQKLRRRPWGLQCDGDVWSAVATALQEKGPQSVMVRWSKGHATEEDVRSGRVSAEDRLGNSYADRFAELAHRLGERLPAVASKHAAVRWEGAAAVVHDVHTFLAEAIRERQRLRASIAPKIADPPSGAKSLLRVPPARDLKQPWFPPCPDRRAAYQPPTPPAHSTTKRHAVHQRLIDLLATFLNGHRWVLAPEGCESGGVTWIELAVGALLQKGIVGAVRAYMGDKGWPSAAQTTAKPRQIISAIRRAMRTAVREHKLRLPDDQCKPRPRFRGSGIHTGLAGLQGAPEWPEQLRAAVYNVVMDAQCRSSADCARIRAGQRLGWRQFTAVGLAKWMTQLARPGMARELRDMLGMQKASPAQESGEGGNARPKGVQRASGRGEKLKSSGRHAGDDGVADRPGHLRHLRVAQNWTCGWCRTPFRGRLTVEPPGRAPAKWCAGESCRCMRRLSTAQCGVCSETWTGCTCASAGGAPGREPPRKQRRLSEFIQKTETSQHSVAATGIQIYWAPQRVAYSAVHALNAVAQRACFSIEQLNAIAHSLGESETCLAGAVPDEPLAGNADPSGNVSSQVLVVAIRAWRNCSLRMLWGTDSWQASLRNEDGPRALICNLGGHWLTYRRLQTREGLQWYDLDSKLVAPVPQADSRIIARIAAHMRRGDIVYAVDGLPAEPHRDLVGPRRCLANGECDVSSPQLSPSASMLTYCANAQIAGAIRYGLAAAGVVAERLPQVPSPGLGPRQATPALDIYYAQAPAGRNDGAHSLWRESVLRDIRAASPRAFILEAGATEWARTRGGQGLLKWVCLLRHAGGYQVKWSAMDAQVFALPLRRERIYVWGVRGSCSLGSMAELAKPTQRLCLADVLGKDLPERRDVRCLHPAESSNLERAAASIRRAVNAKGEPWRADWAVDLSSTHHCKTARRTAGLFPTTTDDDCVAVWLGARGRHATRDEHCRVRGYDPDVIEGAKTTGDACTLIPASILDAIHGVVLPCLRIGGAGVQLWDSGVAQGILAGKGRRGVLAPTVTRDLSITGPI